MPRARILDAFTVVPVPHRRRFEDYTGQVFGRLSVVSFAGTPYYKWNCVCTCGSRVSVQAGALRRGVTTSCGCLNEEITRQAAKKALTTHGETVNYETTPEYRAYHTAKGRCANPTDWDYPRYGGRGIEFRFNSFDEFLADVGRRPTPRHSLDRIDVNGHYEVANIRWATMREQSRNRRDNVMLTVDGVTKCQMEWAEIYAIPRERIYGRRRRGWCDKCAVTIPIGEPGCRHKVALT